MLTIEPVAKMSRVQKEQAYYYGYLALYAFYFL